MRYLLTVLLAAFLAGCAGTVPDPDPTPLNPAFYMGQHPDTRGESYKGQPVEDMKQYGLIVWNPNVPVDDCRKVAPDAVHLGYCDVRWVPAPPEEGGWGSDASVFGAKRRAFPDDAYWYDEAGKRVSIWPNTWELRYTLENAARMAQFILDHYGEWDGVYFDDLHAALPNRYLEQLGVPLEFWPLTQREFYAYRDAIVEQVRAGFPDAKLVSNTGWNVSAVAHLPLDGVCAEEWWPADRGRTLQSMVTDFDPTLCVAWEWDTTTEGVRWGKIRYRPRYGLP